MPQVRIYIQEVIKKNKYIYLEKEKIHYLKNVMRKRTGDIFWYLTMMRSGYQNVFLRISSN